MRSFIIAISFILATPAFAGHSINRDPHHHGAAPVEKKVIKGPKKITKEESVVLVNQSRRLLDAIQQVESGSQKDPANSVGDHGRAHGWFQLHSDFFADSQSMLKGSYMDYAKTCKDADASRIAVVLYWHKYAHENGTRDLAILFHYGTSGLPGKDKYKNDPDAYWPKVEDALKTIK